ncbi:MAG: flavin reductase family protein [Candidatus Binatia bacterium]|nr:flavin reductase family protein [Candidatus Binatia bacterium]
MKVEPRDQKVIDNYLMLVGSIVPRPIAWVSSCGEDGSTNLAPFSFFTCVCVNPPMVSITVSRRGKEEKDTVRNIKEKKEYVVNVVPNQLDNVMVGSAIGLSYGESEIETLGLTAVPSELIDAPRLAESPINLECRLHDIVLLGPHKHTLIIGEVVMFHMKESILTNGLPDMAKLQPVGRLNFDLYCRTQDIYELVMDDHFSQDRKDARKIIPKKISSS